VNTEAYFKLDHYWRAGAAFIDYRFAPGDRLIAPYELAACFPGDQAHSFEDHFSGKYQWVVLHKGMLREAETRGLMAACLALDPVFANEVFVIFAQRKRFEKLDENNIHYQSFLNVFVDEFVPGCLERNGPYSASSLDVTGQNRPMVYMGNNIALTRTAHGQKIYVDTRDLSLAPSLLMDGAWENPVTRIFAKYARKGATVIEVGANMGYYTLLAASLVGHQGKVIAFEANSALSELLYKSVDINYYLHRCEVINKAVADKTGTLTFRTIKEHMGTSSAAQFDQKYLEKWRDTMEETTVESVCLDEFLKERGLHHVDVIKIDAEGSEPLIFKGLQKTLETSGDLTVIFELNAEMIRAMGHEPGEMLESLVEKGFTLQRIIHDDLIYYESVEQALSWPICDVLMRKQSTPQP
jgi:FkbM family methyltransferase